MQITRSYLANMSRTPFSSKENVLLPDTYNIVKQACPPGPGIGKRRGAELRVRPWLGLPWQNLLPH